MLNTKKTFSLKECFNDCQQKIGVYFCDKEIVQGYAISKLDERLNISKAEKVYNVNGKIIVYCQDGYLRIKEKGVYKKFTPVPFPVAPTVFETFNNGKKCVAIKKADGVILVSDRTDYYKTADGDVYYSFFDLNFIAKGNVLKIADAYGYCGTQLNDDMRIIVLSEDFGEIVALSSYKEKLIIVCKKRILTLSFEKDGLYSLDSLEGNEINVDKKSVKKIGDKIFFVSKDNLFAIGDKISKCESMLNKKGFIVYDNAFSFNGCYVLPIQKDGKRWLYLYDTENGCDYLLKNGNLAFCDGGFAIDRENGFSYQLQDGVNGYCRIKSKTTNFNENGKKHLTLLTAYSEYPLTVKIEGDFGEKEYQFLSGEIHLNCNLYSGYYSFTLESETKMKISDIKIVIG